MHSSSNIRTNFVSVAVQKLLVTVGNTPPIFVLSSPLGSVGTFPCVNSIPLSLNSTVPPRNRKDNGDERIVLSLRHRFKRYAYKIIVS